MPIYLLYTDKEILKLRSDLLKKAVLSGPELVLLSELNEYINS